MFFPSSVFYSSTHSPHQPCVKQMFLCLMFILWLTRTRTGRENRPDQKMLCIMNTLFSSRRRGYWKITFTELIKVIKTLLFCRNLFFIFYLIWRFLCYSFHLLGSLGCCLFHASQCNRACRNRKATLNWNCKRAQKLGSLCFSVVQNFKINSWEILSVKKNFLS